MDGVDGVFHLANVAHRRLRGRQADAYWRIDVDGTEALLQAAVKSGVGRFVYFSSVKAMGDPGEEAVDETWNLLPEDRDGLSKRAAEQRVLAAGEESGMHVCILRPTAVYGPGLDRGNLFRMLQALGRRRFPPIPEFGNRRSLVSLDDLVSAAWLAMDCPAANGRTYIVADGVEYSTRALYVAMCSALGIRVPSWCIPIGVLRLGAIVGDMLEYLSGCCMPFNSNAFLRLSGSACYRAERISVELGWQPEQNFFEVLPEIVSGLR